MRYPVERSGDVVAVAATVVMGVALLGIGGHLVGVGALLAYDSPDGERVFPLPVDLLSWTPDTARWFAQPGLWDHRNRSLLVGGAASMKAQRALSRDGWNLFLHLHYEGAPEYAAGWGTLPPG